MRIDFTVGIYQVRRDGEEEWTALTPVLYPAYVSGLGEVRLRERMIERLRDVMRKAPPTSHELFQLQLGTELMRVPIDIRTDKGGIHGTVPLIVEPRWVSETTQKLVVYHPNFRAHWFLADDHDDVAAIAPTFFRHHWAELDEDDLDEMFSDGKDRLAPLAFSAEPFSLLDMLPSRKKDPRGPAGAARPEHVLVQLGIDETRHRSSGTARTSVPRSPYRERLSYLLGGSRPRSVAVIGLPGSGKTSLIRQWIADRLVEDGYPIHKNLDRCHHVWRITGKRLIAGMSYLGQWEERCLSVLDDARKHRGILWIEDLHLFGRLGQSRQSERSFADFFRGPVRRGDLAVIAELTPAQFARLERDAPGLAEALALVAVPPASTAETAQLLLHEVRALETRTKVELHPFVPRTALELGSALFPWRARPGVAIEIVQRVAEDANLRAERKELTPADVLDYLARTTGLSAKLISLDEPLDPAEVEAAFAARVIGQPVATRAATDVILRVRAGLADPNRPVSVMLFTGPTGTGKTELATAIAEYLYGAGERLLRVDMGELSGPDAVARLIGDRWNPDGLLTSRVRAQPFCVVLLDEIEKAHPQALHLLLQLFDEGRLTDANGEVASFASAVVIMTSNLGSRSAAPIGFGETRDRILADVAKAVREFFPVELFNRIDRVVPFEPLTPEVAAQVVDKELAKLLARRGLRERNTFVYAGAAVRRRAVADAFDPRYGARTVKRWLEDQIGGALTDLLATAKPARLRIVRLAEDQGKIQASLEPMEERRPMPGTYVLEGALDLATAALEPAIAQAAGALDRIRRSPVLARARELASGELRYYVDELHQRLAALGELFGMMPALRSEPREPDDDHESAYDEPLHLSSREHKPIRIRGRAGGARPTRPPAGRDVLLAGIAEALLLERVLPELLDPDAHAVTVVISRVGQTADAGGLAIVARCLAQPTWLDDAAAVDSDGKLRAFGAADLVPRAPSGADAHSTPLLGRTRDAALVLRGLFVRAGLEGEHGTWMIRAAAAEPDVIRVELRSGAPHKAAEVLRTQLAGRAELERVLEHGGPMPPNPDVLLPVTRTLTYRPPLRPGESFGIEIEDFSTGWVDRGTARDLPLAVRRAWHLAWSRLAQVPR
ncbi:MAG: ATP-dependent Clp protease ATP-binding subunit [Myxococcales bacterium]|nr:ATP-dependent Clp protease ATP-binding subunit [Myxococcales bacterium]